LLKRNNMALENRHIDFTTEEDFLPENPEVHSDNKKNEKKKQPAQPDSENRKKKVGLKELIDGTFLVRENMIKQLPYLLFLTLLGVVYIGNRFHAERMVRKIDELKIEVGNLRSEQITITSELMNISRPSEVALLVESKGLGLKESMEPPKKLKR
jgi:Bacteriodetes cell division protein (FtsL-like)